MNNYCYNCGTKLDKNIKKCPKCNADIFEKRIDIETKKQEIQKFRKKENTITISIICLLLVSLLPVNKTISSNIRIIISSFKPIIFLTGIVLLVYARKTMQNSKMIKVLFYIVLISVILLVLTAILLLITCVNIVDSGCY